MNPERGALTWLVASAVKAIEAAMFRIIPLRAALGLTEVKWRTQMS